MNARPKLNVALVGAGFLARTRARCWRRVYGVDVELSAVVTRGAPAGEVFAVEFGIGRAVSDLDAVLADRDVDVVDLCVPNHLHRPFTEAAAAAGKAVLCTKPLTAYVGQDHPGDPTTLDPDAVAATDRAVMLQLALADAEAMVAACKAGKVPLLYGENWLFAPAIRRAYELLASSDGVLLEMRGHEAHRGSHSAFSKQWNHTGGGALLRLGAHPIGAMLWLKRLEGMRRDGRPVRVVSVTGNVADPSRHAGLTSSNTAVATGGRGVESFGNVSMHFEDGSVGVAHGSDLSLGGMESRLSLLSSNSHLECSLSPHDQLRAHAPGDGTFGTAVLMEKASGQAGWNTPLPDEDDSSGQQAMLQVFAEVLGTGDHEFAAAIGCDGALGAEVVRIVYSAYLSAAEGRAVALDRP